MLNIKIKLTFFYILKSINGRIILKMTKKILECNNGKIYN